jgi:putative transposase
VRWHRDLFRLFWRVKSRPGGRPRIPAELRQLITEMAVANRTWGEERIAAELRLKLGLTVPPRTVRRYLPRRPRGGRRTQSWAKFLRNHAGAVLGCDFCVVVTATLKASTCSLSWTSPRGESCTGTSPNIPRERR